MDNSLAIRAAWLSYIGGCTQSDIAKQLGISSPKAHRLINQVQKAGLVHVFIDDVPHECLALEDEIQSRFGLTSCSVAPYLQNDTVQNSLELFNSVGAAAGRWLYSLLKNETPSIIGVGKGRSVAAMTGNMPKLDFPALKIVAVSGSLTRKLSANPFDIVHNLAERTQADGYFLPVPYIARNPEERNLLQQQPSVDEILNLGRKADTYIIGIGAIDRDSEQAHIRQMKMVDDEEWYELLRKNVVCDIMGEFLSIDGKAVDSYVNNLSLGLKLADIKGSRVMAVVGGHQKSAAVLAALRTGVITDLVVCEKVAAGLVNLLAKQVA